MVTQNMELKTDQECWDTIADLDWPGNQGNQGNPFNYERRAIYGFDKYGVEGMQFLQQFCLKRIQDLLTAVHEYRQKHGDASIKVEFSEYVLFWHIVGLGKPEYESCLKNPKLLNDRQHVASFAYVFNKPSTPTLLMTNFRLEALKEILRSQVELRNLLRDAEQLSLRTDRMIMDLSAEI